MSLRENVAALVRGLLAPAWAIGLHLERTAEAVERNVRATEALVAIELRRGAICTGPWAEGGEVSVCRGFIVPGGACTRCKKPWPFADLAGRFQP